MTSATPGPQGTVEARVGGREREWLLVINEALLVVRFATAYGSKATRPLSVEARQLIGDLADELHDLPVQIATGLIWDQDDVEARIERAQTIIPQLRQRVAQGMVDYETQSGSELPEVAITLSEGVRRTTESPKLSTYKKKLLLLCTAGVVGVGLLWVPILDPAKSAKNSPGLVAAPAPTPELYLAPTPAPYQEDIQVVPQADPTPLPSTAARTYTDPATGCEYLVFQGAFGGAAAIAPRRDSKGEQKGCVE